MESGFIGQPDIQARTQQALQENPEQPSLATPLENFQADDLVRRAMMFMSDTRGASPETMGTPSDNFLDAMRGQDLPLEQSMGMTIGHMMTLLMDNAKQQGYEYDSDAVLGAGEEIVKLAYLLAKEGGVIQKGPKTLEDGGTVPEYMGTIEELAEEDELIRDQLAVSEGYATEEAEGEDILDQIDYDFSHEELEFLDRVSMEAARYVGMHLEQTGQLDKAGYGDLSQRLIAKDQRDGTISEEPWPGMENMDMNEVIMNTARQPGGGQNG